MLDPNTMHAMGMLMARVARQRAKETDVTANETIDLTPLLKPWKAGPQTVGEVITYGGYPYRVIQAHDSTGNEGWNPADVPALFAPYHGTDKAHALPWAAPTHAGDAYMSGEYMIYTDGLIYMCKQDSTVHAPDVLPGAWEEA